MGYSSTQHHAPGEDRTPDPCNQESDALPTELSVLHLKSKALVLKCLSLAIQYRRLTLSHLSTEEIRCLFDAI